MTDTSITAMRGRTMRRLDSFWREHDRPVTDEYPIASWEHALTVKIFTLRRYALTIYDRHITVVPADRFEPMQTLYVAALEVQNQINPATPWSHDEAVLVGGVIRSIEPILEAMKAWTQHLRAVAIEDS